MKNLVKSTVLIVFMLALSCKPNLELDREADADLLTTPRAFALRKGVTLAGDLNDFIVNNYALLQQVINSGAGVIGVNLPWYEAAPTSPVNPQNWNDPVYAGSQAIAKLDKISNYVKNHGNGAIVMAITWGTPAWAACPGDNVNGHDIRMYPPKNASDYGDFMYAMSERYKGTYTNIGKVRDWVVYNEVNTPDWWHNTTCNPQNLDPVYYYGAVMNAAYTAIHHLPANLDVRALAGGFTSYHHSDNLGTAGLRISTSYSNWSTQTNALHNGQNNHAWISPIDFVTAMKNYNILFDAIALHPYAPKIYDNPLQIPPTGAISLGNLDVMLNHLQALYPGDNSKWHLCLTEYHQQSYYGNNSVWPETTLIPCPNYFCSETTEANLSTYVQSAYGTGGANKPYVDYLVWTMWNDETPYTGGIVRANGTDKNAGMGSGSVRATYTAIQ
jgi:hypothetical protein